MEFVPVPHNFSAGDRRAGVRLYTDSPKQINTDPS
jgi:hypothetical protein